MVIYFWILTPLLFLLFIEVWARQSPDDAMSAIGNLRRRFRSWVWRRAKERYLRAHKDSGQTESSLINSANQYADDYTLEILGEPGEAETYW